MSVFFDYRSGAVAPAVAPSTPRGERNTVAVETASALQIGLINNMPDSALQATERQFLRLLNAAAGKRLVRLHFFSLPSLKRSAECALRVKALYSDIGALGRTRLDGLIVTGTEPRAAELPQEPYWRELTEIVDWAEGNTSSTIWSCLAAHAAVLHLDGIERRRLPEKRSGVFDCNKAGDDRLVEGLPWPLKVAHSRCNDLSESELAAHGYRVLTNSNEAGVDIFVKQWRSLFVFFQGHPEYHAKSLQREYSRDIGRYLAGEREFYPAMPNGYFVRQSEQALTGFRERALAARDPALLDDFPEVRLRPTVFNERAEAATAIFANWLGYLAARKAA